MKAIYADRRSQMIFYQFSAFLFSEKLQPLRKRLFFSWIQLHIKTSVLHKFSYLWSYRSSFFQFRVGCSCQSCLQVLKNLSVIVHCFHYVFRCEMSVDFLSFCTNDSSDTFLIAWVKPVPRLSICFDRYLMDIHFQPFKFIKVISWATAPVA